MQRIFVYFVNDLDFEKKDLNEPNSPNRVTVGILSRAITNSIFLSHKLRENILIRIYVHEPIPHVYQISSDRIRYLGPEERSFASIIRKAERYFLDKNHEELEGHKWFQPNPGLFLIKNSNPFIELEQLHKQPFTVINFQDTKTVISLKKFEDLILTIPTNSTIIVLDSTVADGC